MKQLEEKKWQNAIECQNEMTKWNGMSLWNECHYEMNDDDIELYETIGRKEMTKCH